MRRQGSKVIVLVVALALVLTACTAGGSDHYALFRGGYFAEVEGTLNGAAFAATVRAEPLAQGEGGSRAVTVTLYAPKGLSGTILARDGEGAVTLTSGEVVLENPAGTGFFALLDLFPTAGEITRVFLTEEGYTRVVAEAHTLTLLPDGTPYTLTTPEAEVRVIAFEQMP